MQVGHEAHVETWRDLKPSPALNALGYRRRDDRLARGQGLGGLLGVRAEICSMNISARIEQFTAEEAEAVANGTAAEQIVQISGND